MCGTQALRNRAACRMTSRKLLYTSIAMEKKVLNVMQDFYFWSHYEPRGAAHYFGEARERLKQPKPETWKTCNVYAGWGIVVTFTCGYLITLNNKTAEMEEKGYSVYMGIFFAQNTVNFQEGQTFMFYTVVEVLHSDIFLRVLGNACYQSQTCLFTVSSHRIYMRYSVWHNIQQWRVLVFQSVSSSFPASGTTGQITVCTGVTVKGLKRKACPFSMATVEYIMMTSSQHSK